MPKVRKNKSKDNVVPFNKPKVDKVAEEKRELRQSEQDRLNAVIKEKCSEILEIIDYTIVTSDSVNMISELATLSKPLFIFHFSKENKKISFFISNLKELNIVQDYHG